ncbi:MAG: topoisomerase C-terminal repeat-containing protein, partial [Rhizobiaceae bacterium]
AAVAAPATLAPEAAAEAKPKKKRTSKAKSEAVAAPKPKRISLPRGLDPETLELSQALALLALPRSLGQHPETGQEISAGLGRFGPYLRAGDVYVSLKGDDNVLEIGLNRACDLLAQARPGKAKGKSVGDHPADGKPVVLKAGRYGAYVEHGGVRATLPAGTEAETLELDAAVALLAEKAGRDGGTKRPAKAPRSKAASPKAASPKTASPKTAVAKPASAKPVPAKATAVKATAVKTAPPKLVPAKAAAVEAPAARRKSKAGSA